MSWILALLKNMPAIMAAIQTLIAIFTAKSAMANHAAFQASVAAGNAMAASDWNWYVAGQGGGAAAAAVGAIALACCQPTANRVFAAFAREQAATEAALGQVLNSREQAAIAFQLRSQMLSLSPECQAIVKGN